MLQELGLCIGKRPLPEKATQSLSILVNTRRLEPSGNRHKGTRACTRLFPYRVDLQIVERMNVTRLLGLYLYTEEAKRTKAFTAIT